MKVAAPPLSSRSRVRALLVALLLVAISAYGTLSPIGSAMAASPPSAPTNVVGTPASASVALSWMAPASTGGSRITGYRVRYSTNNGSSWSSSQSTHSTSTQYTVTRLTNGRSYVFQVRATNRVGNGPWSAPSPAVIPTTTLPPPPPPPPPPPGTTQSIAVPSYFYPGTLWTQLESGAPTVGLAIINPNSGPGDYIDPSYVNQVNSTRAKGIAVIGYVHTSYALRSLRDVKAEIDKQFSWYGVDGIFLDEVTTSCATAAFYSDLYSYIKARSSGARVVLNPGTKTGECYMASSDIIVTFEDSYESYVGWQPSDWESTYSPQRFWHLVITTSAAQMGNAIALSKSRGIGWVYVTDDTGGNPWDTLPSYWGQELALLATS